MSYYAEAASASRVLYPLSCKAGSDLYETDEALNLFYNWLLLISFCINVVKLGKSLKVVFTLKPVIKCLYVLQTKFVSTMKFKR